ncbi:trypsin-like serine peptidase [Streptomyces gobiensis]|uniref:trypsin-like serine peptidase n=1 Tax=Streptomyces gobiensis TaxID=2875706 RepID=UPI001E48ABD8|nr:trypsin-like peptidase domain-containing protein [Streptomyces gobiensis]UGY92706.1 hypothetical protein test1122_13905 [Streptomyces gobiensis]
MEQIRRVIAGLATGVTAIALVGVTFPGPRAADIPDSRGDPWAGKPVESVGKIITDLGDGRVGVCSGAVVDSPSGSVVATAAHCVNTPDFPDTPIRGWFAPGYDRIGTAGAMKSGWKIESYHTPPGWDVSQRIEKILPHDYAFVTVEKKDGESVQDAHGANALAFTPVDARQRVVALGYAAGPPFDGESLSYCAGAVELLTEVTAHKSNVGGLLLEPCRLTRGASGGPWLQGFDEASRTGTVVGVLSVGSGAGQVLGRPYPAHTGRALFERAARAS